nr:diguanylate cyclase [Marivita sp. S6314]
MIVDALSNRRIHLRAQLDTSSYVVNLADSLLDGLTQIKEDPPDVVILAHDLPGLKLPRVCKLLRSNPRTQLTTVVVAVSKENHSERVSALTAGAHDLIEFGADRADLRARMRSIMRDRFGSDMPPPIKDAFAAQGFSEPKVAFDDMINVTLVSPGQSAVATQLRQVPGLSLRTSSDPEARRAPEPETDIFILFEDRNADDARDTLLALRSHPCSRHSTILFVSDHDAHGPSPLDLGADDHVVGTVTAPEIALRLKRLAARKREADMRRKTVSELDGLVHTDALTKVNNRRFADSYFKTTDRNASLHRKSLAVLLLDVDTFKTFNDTHGHLVGDTILAHIADVLSKHIRKGDMLARFGGDEFVVALPNVKQPQARRIAERLRKAVAETPLGLPHGPHLRPTISIGLAQADPIDQKSSGDLIKAADTALYRAKRLGRNKLCTATTDDFHPARALPAAVPRSHTA